MLCGCGYRLCPDDLQIMRLARWLTSPTRDIEARGCRARAIKLCGTLFQPHALQHTCQGRKWEKNTSWRWIVVLTHVLKVQSLSCCLYTNPVNGGSLSTNLRSAIVGKPFGELQKLSPAFAETRLCKDHILPAYCGLFLAFRARQSGEAITAMSLNVYFADSKRFIGLFVGMSQSRFVPSVSLLHPALFG